MYKKYILHLFLVSTLWMAGAGCKKLVTVDEPASQMLTSVVFESDNTAKLAVTGMYNAMVNGSTQASKLYTTTLPALTADELIYYPNTSLDQFRYNYILSSDGANYQLWQESYQVIYYANAVIEGSKASKGMTSPYKNTATGEALFIRAWMHFYLVNFFGDVPLITTTDVNKTAMAPRTPTAEIYDQVIADLKEAQTLLDTVNISPANRTRANKFTTAALLARVYLYRGEWTNAEAQANIVIGNPMYSLLSNATMGNVFLANSTEAIWQLTSWNNNGYTTLGSNFLPSTTSPSPKYVLTDQLYGAFETGDKRKTSWVNSLLYMGTTYYYPYKYKQQATTTTNIEYTMLLRLAEQYLIRAEALAQQNKLNEAKTDLNTIRNRAGLANTTALTKDELLTAIYKERRVELFAEQGHRWFDLRRSNTIDAVLGALKPGFWKPDAAWYPVPLSAINTNSNLSQNNGY